MNHFLSAMALVSTSWLATAGAQEMSTEPVQTVTPPAQSITANRCAAAQCVEVQPQNKALRMEAGAATRHLLQRQAQGGEASIHQHAMSGVVAQKVYERYVNSFKHPIAEHSTSAIAKSGQGSK